MSVNDKKDWQVYIAQSTKTKRFYTGIAINLEKRLKSHNSGNGAKFAVDQGPLKLVYKSGAIYSKSEARRREMQIKPWRQEKKVWLIKGIIE